MLSEADARSDPGFPDEEAARILFPDGLVGCPDWRQFALQPGPAGSPVSRLRCLSEPSVCFVVVDPRHVQPDYSLAAARDQLLDLGLDAVEDALVFCTLAVRGEPPVITANLLAPLVINPTFRVGKQVVLAESGYSTRRPVALPARSRGLHAVQEGV